MRLDESISGLLSIKAEANKKTLGLYEPSQLLNQAFDHADPIIREIKDSFPHNQLEYYILNQRKLVNTHTGYSDVISFCDKILDLVDPIEITRIQKIRNGIIEKFEL
jgi:hypothetical protein